MFNKINEAHLLREIADLKSQIEELKNEQIKQRRDNSDLMYNLDSDNVPSLNGIVKEIRLIVKDGAVNGALIIQAINNSESEAQILASHINLSGMTINLNAGEGITITSPNFSLTKEGNMTCQNAEIKKSCRLATDLGNVDDGEENGMLIGPIQETDEYRSATWMSSTRTFDGPGVRFTSEHYDKIKERTFKTELVVTGKRTKLFSVYFQKNQETGVDQVKGYAGMGLTAFRYGDTKEPFPRAYIVGKDGESALWFDDGGELCTTSADIHTGKSCPIEIMMEVTENFPFPNKEES